jgi:CubicO group peptidase (beta-lactamase class C family)
VTRRSATCLIAALALAACAAPAPLPLPDTGLATRADTLMRELVARQRFQGAVVIGRGERIDYAAGFGFADIERRVPFTPDTPTDGASIAKTFTAAALLMLAQERRVDLEAPVASRVPGYPHAATRVRHLLAHSAGLNDYDWLDPPRSPAGEPRTNASHMALVARDLPQPNFPPGSAFTYDNVAYDMAAMVAERASGQDYASLMAQRFFQPLGLDATFVRPARFADWQGVRTRGYRRTAEGWKDHDAYDLEGFHGAANIYPSARDLQRWMAGYRRVVGDSVYRAAMAPARLDDGRATGISLGSWFVSADGTRRYYTGHHNGFFNLGYADDARDLFIAWVANDAPPSWLQAGLTRALVAVAEGREPERLVAPPLADPDVDPAGTYRVPEVGDVAVQRDGKLLRVLWRGVAYQGFPVARGVHYVPGIDAYVRFAAAPGGGVTMAWDSVYVVAPAVPAAAR